MRPLNGHLLWNYQNLPKRVETYFKLYRQCIFKLNFLSKHAPDRSTSVIAQEQAPVSPNEAREPVGILLMPPFYDTSSWYHDMIG